ncbi:MAG: bifunctional glycosyltransferase family 2 protein/CDP-glycerol:glycerophosphate glycerophosphotransferase [Lachnospiraceae bacterium]|nr:bifunctional glycosyltransferase family 2 protein/CDP-glycerol:glycerophosphate glycerophosphotransferase [Lachnospiraceae bacterium]
MKISVIIPHFRGSAYLKDALESLRLQEYPELDVLLIKDGCSEDLGDLLEEYACLNIRVFDTGAKKGEPLGVPTARNIGLKNADGEYIFFLDSDDYLSDGYFKALLEMAAKYPDIMIRSSKKKTYFKREGQLLREEQQRQLLEQQAESSETDDDEAENPEDVNEGDELDAMGEDGEAIQEKYKFGSATVLGLLIPRRVIDTTFNEKYRYYSDLPFMSSICRNAPLMSCKEVRYYKRTHNDAIRMPSLLQEEAEGKGKEFIKSLSDAWESAKEGPKFTPVLTSEYALSQKDFNPNLSYIETYTLNYVLRKLTKGKHPVGLTKWSNEDIGAFTPFFEKIPKAKIKRYKFFRRRIIKKIAAGNIKGARKTANFYSMKKKKKGLFGTPMQWKWNIYKRIFRKLSVRKDFILFESFLGRSYGDSSRYIYEYLQKLNAEGKLGSGNIIPQNPTFIWMIDNKAAKIPGKHKQVKFNSLRYFYYVARCAVWVTNMRQPSWYVKRPGVILLECWHGTPLKRLVFDMEDVHSASPKYKMTVYNQSRMWDYLISDNRFSTECFKRCFLFPEERILELGYPRNDLLYGDDKEERARKIKEKLGIPQDKKVVLYAPTWRDDDYYGPAQYKFDLPLDLEMMKSLRDRYYFILRTHYFIADHLNIPKEDADFVSDQSRYNDIGELYLISDILITDYSSVFFDFANLRRPILFFVYDLEKYAGVLRGFYFDMTTGCPGPLLKTNEEVLDALENIENVEAEYAEKYKEFCDKFCYLDDGHASERIVERVFGTHVNS